MASKDAGFAFKFTEGVACLPAREEEEESDIALLEEDEETLQDIVDSANFELDMDAIVLGNDEEWQFKPVSFRLRSARHSLWKFS